MLSQVKKGLRNYFSGILPVTKNQVKALCAILLAHSSHTIQRYKDRPNFLWRHIVIDCSAAFHAVNAPMPSVTPQMMLEN